jgi:hypothetical protein
MSSPVIKSIQINQFFWISVILSVLFLSYITMGNSVSSYISGIYTYIFIAFWGYLMHYISHEYTFTELYTTSTNPILKKIRSIPILNTVIKTILETSIDFHSITHHNTEINRTPNNVIVEVVQNFLTQGALLVLFNNYLSPTFSFSRPNSSLFKIKLNNNILLLWALFYATVHNINYRFTHPIEHENHHLDPQTNYGIDIVDIILNSKYNTKHKNNNNKKDKHTSNITIEDHNHAAINIIIITIMLSWPYLK